MVQDTSPSSEMYLSKSKNGVCGGWGMELADTGDDDVNYADLRECTVLWAVNVPGESPWCSTELDGPEDQQERQEYSAAIRSHEITLAHKFPHPTDPHVGVQVKIYDSNFGSEALKSTDLVTFVGILTTESSVSLTYAPSDRLTARVRSSSSSVDIDSTAEVPTLHVLFIRSHPHSLISRPYPCVLQEPPALYTAQLRDDLLTWIAEEALDGDRDAAEWVLLACIARVQSRNPSLLPPSLTITHFPQPPPIPSTIITPREPIPTLSLLLQYLIPLTRTLPLSLNILNKKLLAPESKDEDLHAGALQLPQGTFLLVTESGIKEGKLTEQGYRNIHTLQEVISTQTLAYVFPFSQFSFQTDMSCVVLSEGSKSAFFKTDLSYPIRTTPAGRASLYKLEDDVVLPPPARLAAFRDFVVGARSGKVQVDEATSEYIQRDFVRDRQQDKSITSDDLIRRMTVAKLYALSLHESTLTIERPSLASAWEPFYSSSPSFSAHSTTSIVSLQGKTALPGHPKTLRDLSHVTEVLMLPSSFGAIQLGETFTSCLSVNNEASVDVESVTLTVEVQTASTKATVAEFGGPDFRLAVGESLEKVVGHEIKELGQHALACTISYRLPSGIRAPVAPAADSNDPNLYVFRKFYKFAVTNPLSVKTKVHVPRAPSATFSRVEREKVFLEIHVQNLTQDAMWLERMRLECADGWKADDANLMNDEDASESVFSGSMGLMQPHDMRQYIYILSPVNLALFPTAHQPGSVVPLGRLDITWKSSFGEPGRLLTSMLSRRIPLIQAPPQLHPPASASKQLASAIPLHLQRASSVAATPPRPRSPQLPQRPLSPPANATGPAPYRPGSPFRNRTSMPPLNLQPLSVPSSPNPAIRRQDDVDVDLVIRNIPRADIKVESSFVVDFTLNVLALVPIAQPSEIQSTRLLSLVIQHVQRRRQDSSSAVAAEHKEGPLSPRLPSSGFSSPSPYETPHRADFQDFLARRLLVASPRRLNADDESSHTELDGGRDTPAPADVGGNSGTIALPPPFIESEEEKQAPSPSVVYLGSSAVFLPQLRLTPSADSVSSAARGHLPAHDRNISTSTVGSDADSELDNAIGNPVAKVVVSKDFQLSYLPLRHGFATFGGLRVVLVEDRLVDDSNSEAVGTRCFTAETRALKEWGVVGEVWVPS
ncbi:uncharacterized protein FIBRA_05974 [Fibroporia radiculosa]|uniref:Trafficking protein particle complex subunit 13 middle domain-containing protein n=1 Tax=Fibroporia radiculosa TaxID=599839 RepID=J4GRY7_9APHY|nr:uncharacterized protein FIBRA_05974 [Fibroporia radiculosa]CCM03825.1 predicted protein [Fibroporia radiculosa]